MGGGTIAPFLFLLVLILTGCGHPSRQWQPSADGLLGVTGFAPVGETTGTSSGVVSSLPQYPALPGIESDVYRSANHLYAILDRYNFPYTFGCGGLTWNAVRVDSVADEFRLVPVTTAMEGYAVYRLRGGESSKHLFLRIADSGPLAHCYIWYAPGGGE